MVLLIKKNFNLLKPKQNKVNKYFVCLAILICSLSPFYLYGDSAKLISKIESQIPTEPLKFDNESTATSRYIIQPATKHRKKRTDIYFLSGVNNLGYFLRKNLSQLAEVGSTEFVNILVQLDVLLPDNTKVTKRYYVEKNKLIILNHNDPSTQSMDSGDPNTLINWCQYCIEHYPADQYSLILSNHGTGIIEIGQTRAVNPSELFTFNPNTNMIELNRSLPFLEFISSPENQRGICFDDITRHYITNQRLEQALKTICEKYIKGKFETIIFDACLQQMYEIAILLKPYARFMLGSQEVILAPGLDYEDVLKPFEKQMVDPLVFVKHIVASYENTYKRLTNDYTFSAIDLTDVAFLENSVNHVASLLIDCLKNKNSSLVYEAIKASRHKLLCTHFDEPSYIDLHHFFINLLTNIERAQSKADKTAVALKSTLSNLTTSLRESLQIIKHVVIANVAGKNVNQAQGISIYFPEHGRMHPSYKYPHAWCVFLDYYLHYK